MLSTAKIEQSPFNSHLLTSQLHLKTSEIAFKVGAAFSTLSETTTEHTSSLLFWAFTNNPVLVNKNNVIIAKLPNRKNEEWRDFISAAAEGEMCACYVQMYRVVIV